MSVMYYLETPDGQPYTAFGQPIHSAHRHVLEGLRTPSVIVERRSSVPTEPCGKCVDGWVCSNPNSPGATFEDPCPVCDGDTVVPVYSMFDDTEYSEYFAQ